MKTSNWFSGIVPERPTLVLINEPPDHEVLGQLAEQLSSRASKWKVVVAVRSPNDAVVGFLRRTSIKRRVQELAVSRLPPEDAVAMVVALLRAGPLAKLAPDRIEQTAKDVVKYFDCHPIWLTLAVHSLEHRGGVAMVARDAESLANEYIDEIVGSGARSKQVVLSLLESLALIGTLNRDDAVVVEGVAQRAGLGNGPETLEAIAELVERRALAVRGARGRLVEIKPDVVRDHVLLRLLTRKTGRLTPARQGSVEAAAIAAEVARELVAGSLSDSTRAAAISLGRTELLLREAGEDVPLLSTVFRQLVAACRDMALPQIRALAASAELLGSFRPAETAELILALRERIQELGEAEEILRLAWPTFCACMGASNEQEQRDALRVLAQLIEDEASICLRRPLPNDGKRAAELFERVLAGGPEFRFDDIATVAEELYLATLRGESWNEKTAVGRIHRLRGISKGLTTMVRHQTWSDNVKFYWTNRYVHPSEKRWAVRETVVRETRARVEDARLPLSTRVEFWRILGDAHEALRFGMGMANKDSEIERAYRAASLDDLDWALKTLSARSLEIEELVVVRHQWQWHVKSEDYEGPRDDDFERRAVALQGRYLSNDLARELTEILTTDNWERTGTLRSETARRLANGSAEDIRGFVARCERFLGRKDLHISLSGIFAELGCLGPALPDEARAYLRSVLLEELPRSSVTDLACVAVAHWIAGVRQQRSSDEAYELSAEVARSCTAADSRLVLLLETYRVALAFKGTGPREHELLRAYAREFCDGGMSCPYLELLGQTFSYGWPDFKRVIVGVLDSAEGDDALAKCLRSLVRGLYRGVESTPAGSVPEDLLTWFIGLLPTCDNAHALEADSRWYFDELVKRLPPLSISWLRHWILAEDQAVRVRAAQWASYGRVAERVPSITSEQGMDPVVRAHCEAIIDGLCEHYLARGCLAKVIAAIDPNGEVAPHRLAQLAVEASTGKTLREVAELCRAYPVGSPQWRTCVRPLLGRVNSLPSNERNGLFYEMAKDPVTSWSAPHGEVPKVFVAAVELASAGLGAEQDPLFLPFWQWQAESAKKELDARQEEAKEDRGE